MGWLSQAWAGWICPRQAALTHPPPRGFLGAPKRIHAHASRWPRAPGPAADISLEAEIPEDLFNGMHEFMRSHPHWDQYRLITSALAGFLFQNGCSDRCVTQHYLDGLFMKAGSS